MKLAEQAKRPFAVTTAKFSQSDGVGASSVPARIDSLALFGTARELLIEHAGCTYRLRITQANKLILTK